MIFSVYNPGQNIWNKMQKSGKPEQEKKSLVSIFACFLIAIAKVRFLERIMGTRLCAHPNLRWLQYFLISYDPKS